MHRQTAVAGSFYSDQEDQLQKELLQFMPQIAPQPTKAKAILAPHAGYMYSGTTAGAIYQLIEVPDLVFILSPNHTGYGTPISLYAQGEWATPLGSIPINEMVTRKMMDQCSLVTEDYSAHQQEHSIEVHLPFLKSRNPDISIVPLTLANLDSPSTLAFAKEFSGFLANLDQPYLIVISSDMNHFESSSILKEKNDLVLAEIEKFDPQGLYQTVHNHNISMCGYVPTVGVMETLRLLYPQNNSKIIHQSHSGEINGDHDSVVGYVSILFT